MVAPEGRFQVSHGLNWSSTAYALRSPKWSFMRHQNPITFPYWPIRTSSKHLGYWSTLSPAIHNDHSSIRPRAMKCSFYQQLVTLESCRLGNIEMLICVQQELKGEFKRIDELG